MLFFHTSTIVLLGYVVANVDFFLFLLPYEIGLL